MSKWYKTHMHLHASYEEVSSMRSHASQAQQLGMDVLYITEHDVRMIRMENCVSAFSLKQAGPAVWENGTGWLNENGDPCRSVADGDGFSLVLNDRETASFFSPGKKHQASLFAMLTVKMAFVLPEETALRIDFALSLRPDLIQQHLYYEIGDCPGGEETAWRIPVQGSGAFELTLPISEDVLRFDEMGQDQAFCTVRLTAFGEKPALCRGFAVDRQYVGEEVRRRQQEAADKIGPQYGLRIYAADEISKTSDHRNSYSEFVPILNYEQDDYRMTGREAAQYVIDRGGTLSYNHPFFNWKRIPFTPEEHPGKIEEMAQIMLDCRADGAQLMEVGFPDGRHNFSMREHLQLWDLLAMRGLCLTGYGDSDCHDSRHGWFSGNNFATWLYADSDSRLDLEKAMRTGRAYGGDPARWHGQLAFRAGDVEMGDFLCAQEAEFRIDLSGITEPLTCVIVCGGETIQQTEIGTASFRMNFRANRGDKKIAPVRFELYGADQRCVLFSNPIYLYDGNGCPRNP